MTWRTNTTGRSTDRPRGPETRRAAEVQCSDCFGVEMVTVPGPGDLTTVKCPNCGEGWNAKEPAQDDFRARPGVTTSLLNDGFPRP